MESEELKNTASVPEQAEGPSPDLSSYYAAAAQAAGSGHEPDSPDESEREGGSAEEEAAGPASSGADMLGGPIDADGPHGPLSELNEDEEDGMEDDGGKNELAAGSASAPAERSSSADDDEEDEEEEGAEDDVSMGLLGHANELRRRLMRIVLILLLGWVGLFCIAEPMYSFFASPLQAALPPGSKMIYTSPQGMFFTYLKVAAIASLFCTSPLTFYQVWAFIAPGLYREEKRALLPLAFSSSVLFIGGAAFCFWLVFPIAFKFFMGFATAEIQPMISVEEYLSFALKILIAFGVVFEMPLFSFFLARFGILSPRFMKRSRPYAVILVFVLAALLTPPDVISQVLMAVPMMILYEISIYVCAAAYNKEKAALRKAGEQKDE